MRRRTIGREIHIQGVGLHKGGPAAVSIRPGSAGIVFVKQGERIPASPENVVDTRLNTTLGKRGVTVSTVEHLMSSLWGLSVTDCEIEIHGEEIPVLDGSALPFYIHILGVGLEDLPGEVLPMHIHDLIRIEEGDSFVEASPGSFSVTYEIEFPSSAIGRQRYSYDGLNYDIEIAPARTFGLLSDVEKMRSAGLALGGSLENAVVVDGAKVLNPEGLRFPDEFVRHKILDILGDLWTLGAPLEAGVRAYKASHRLHIALAKKIREVHQQEGSLQ
jgi:UDP-3-O-[3-hydroxymyristoyl] N-acetylglucosamine deacetylase